MLNYFKNMVSGKSEVPDTNVNEPNTPVITTNMNSQSGILDTNTNVSTNIPAPKKIENMTLEEYTKSVETKSLGSLNSGYIPRETPGNNPNPGSVCTINVEDYIKSVEPKSVNSVSTKEVDNIRVCLNQKMNIDDLFGAVNDEGALSSTTDRDAIKNNTLDFEEEDNEEEKEISLTPEQEAEIRLTSVSNLPKLIMNTLLPYNYRTLAFNLYHDEFKDASIELVRTISGQYNFSGDITTENYIKYLIDNSNLSTLLKIDFAQTLCSFIKGKIDDVLQQKDELDYQLDRIHKRLGTRKRRNTRKMTEEEVSFLYEEVENDLKRYNDMRYTAFSYYLRTLGRRQYITVFGDNGKNTLEPQGGYVSNMDGISNTCKFRYLMDLANSLLFPKETREIFYDIMKDDRIDIKFRYTSMLSTEKSQDEILCIDLMENFIDNTNLVMNDRDEDKFYAYISYVILACQYIMNKTTEKIELKESQEDALTNTTSSHMEKPSSASLNKALPKLQKEKYRILNFPLFNKAQKILLLLSENKDLKVQTRSDCIDILLNRGDDETNKRAQQLILLLGGKGINVYENKQNVHNVDIEESVIKIIEFLYTLPQSENNVEMYDSDEEIEGGEGSESGDCSAGALFDKKKPLEGIYRTIRCIKNEYYSYVQKKDNINLRNLVKRIETEGESALFNLDESKVLEPYFKIEASLNRILLDRQLYSRYSWSLKNILIKVWDYIQSHMYRETMTERLFEELQEMSGWCSSGYASRLVNSICGFGDFSINVGFENQIKANLTGRLNKKIMDIQDQGLRDLLLDEMTEKSGNYLGRKLFLKFFRENIPAIKEELYLEFRGHVSDADFDLYMIKAIQHYEGNNY